MTKTIGGQNNVRGAVFADDVSRRLLVEESHDARHTFAVRYGRNIRARLHAQVTYAPSGELLKQSTVITADLDNERVL